MVRTSRAASSCSDRPALVMTAATRPSADSINHPLGRGTVEVEPFAVRMTFDLRRDEPPRPDDFGARAGRINGRDRHCDTRSRKRCAQRSTRHERGNEISRRHAIRDRMAAVFVDRSSTTPNLHEPEHGNRASADRERRGRFARHLRRKRLGGSRSALAGERDVIPMWQPVSTVFRRGGGLRRRQGTGASRLATRDPQP